MAVPLDRPVVSPIIVGREPHLEALERAIEQVAAGRGQVVLVAGEAGVGKSRLVAEAKQRAAGRSLLNLQGNCFEPDRSLPYAPIADLLRALFATRPPDEVVSHVGPVASELMTVLPELAAWCPGATSAGSLEPEQAQRRLVHALTQLFAGLAATQPLLIVLEDLHWGDEA